ncbi:MAG: ABC transporter permease [Bacteroidota bacterium]
MKPAISQDIYGYGTERRRSEFRKKIGRNWDLYLLILPVLAYFVIFHYWPMLGIQIAFKKFYAIKGIWGSPWVGFENFARFFGSYYFWRLIGNTLGISLMQLVIGFPAPILLALMLNEVRNKYFKKSVQMITYAPHFLSIVVVVGMMVAFLSPTTGNVNYLIQLLGGKPIFFMAESSWFKPLYVLSGIWQNAGWRSIIFIAALANIDPQLYEAAEVDGASKLQRIRHVTIPGILPTAIIMLIMETGRVMNIGFEKAFLMQNPANIAASEVISTYVYKVGLLNAQFSFATAVGLFNAVVNICLLLMVNRIAKHVSQTSLW